MSFVTVKCVLDEYVLHCNVSVITSVYSITREGKNREVSIPTNYFSSPEYSRNIVSAYQLCQTKLLNCFQ